MPTPVTAFADAAAKYGGVDPDDIEAVQHWFIKELPKQPPDVIEQVLHDLLDQDGAAPNRKIPPAYPHRAPLPSLASSPHATSPLLAERLTRILARLLGR